MKETVLISPQIRIPYLVRRSKRRKKTISIKIEENENVVVLCPWKTPKEEIEQLLRERGNWIIKTLAAHKRAKQRLPSIKNGKMMFLGKQYILKCSEGNGKRNKVRTEGATIIFESKKPVDAEKREEKTRKILINWLRKKAEDIINERVRKFQEIMYVQPREVKIRSYKARWGCHSGNGVLTFNLFLVMAPLEIVDYVVVHELAHLLENNHSIRFWSQVERILPDYAQRRKWLKENGMILRI